MFKKKAIAHTRVSSTPAKSVSKLKDKEILSEQAFWVHEGPVVQSVKELPRVITEMSDEQFDYHTKRDGNDFAQWIEGVYGHAPCASAVRRARTRTGVVRAIEKCL